MESLFLKYLAMWPPLGYLLIAAAIFVEGHVALIVVGFLASQGIIPVSWALLSVLVGVFSSDYFWYWLGGRLRAGKDWRNWKEKAEGYSERFDRHLLNHPGKTLFIAKFIYGTYRVSLVRVGMLGVSRNKFWKDNLRASLLWIFVWGGVSYGFGATMAKWHDQIRFMELGMLFSVVVIFAAEIGVGKYLKNRAKIEK